MCKVISGFIKQSSNDNSGSGGGGSKDINELKQKVAELQEKVAANTVAIGLLENGKAPVFHTHETEDINGFEDALAEYTYAYAEAVITVTLDSDRQVDSIVCVENGAEEELTTFDNFTSKIRTIRLTIIDSDERLVFDGPAFYYSLKEGTGVNPLRKQYIQAGHITISRVHGIRAWGAWEYTNLVNIIPVVDGKADKSFQTIVFTKDSSSYTDVSCGNESLDTDAEALYGVMQQIISEIGEYVTCKLVVDNNGNDTETLGLLSYSWSDAVIEGHTMRTHAYTIAVGALVFLFEIVEETQAGTFTAGNITKTDLSSSL